MKLTFILLTAALLHVSANTLSQTVTFSGKGVSLEKVFATIEKQTGYVFFYDESLLDKSKPVTLSLHNTPLEEALKATFDDQPFSWQIVNKMITIVKRPTVTTVLQEFIPPPALDIRGKVIDENGNPAQGVTVTIKGTKIGTATDARGEFQLRSVDDKATIVFSGTNIETYEVKVNGRAELPVLTVKTKINQLSETVVVGYGTTKRKDLTGSVASVNVSEIKNIPFLSVDNAMVGKAAGVQITKADGSPGGAVRVRIRGGSSLIGTNEPLYIIDGVPVTVENKYVGVTEMTNPVENQGESSSNSISGSFARGLNNLAGLNIDDIETIDILKDASATAIYGSKAANGVVIITTKKGKLNQKPVLEFNYYYGGSTPTEEKLLNRDQYRMILQEAAKNRVSEDTRLGRPQDPNAAAIAANPDVLGDGNTDWLDLVLRNGSSQNANISVRGGGTGSRYYTSLSYNKTIGTLIGTDFSRISGKVSLDNEITKRFRVITNMDYGFVTQNVTNGLYGQAMLAPPTFRPYSDDGTYRNFDSYNKGSDPGMQNPLALASATNQAKTNSIIGSISIEYDILKDLRFRSTASANYSNYNQLNYIPSYLEAGNNVRPGGVGSEAQRESINKFFENTVTWNKEFNKDNRLNLLAGTSWEKYKSSFFSAEGKGFPDDNYLNNLNSAALATSVKGSDPDGQNALLSFYSRANYSLKEKYLFTLTGRADISSKFPEGQQAGYFPSGAVAWRMSEENFLKNVNWIDEIKLRVSAGYTGSQSIGDHLFRTLYSPTSYAGTSALVPSQLGNKDIEWESTLQKDLGLDFSLFNTRLRGTFGYYNKTTEGLLLNFTPPPSSAYGSVIMNIATIKNEGLEFDLRGDIVRSKKVQWNSAMNISSNRSKVTNVNGGPFSDPKDRNNLNLGTSVVAEGEPLGLLYTQRDAVGVFQSQKEVDTWLANFPVYPGLGNTGLLFNRYLGVGDMQYDTSNFAASLGLFGKAAIIGRTEPKFFGGMTNTVTFKNISLITLLTYSYGNDILYQMDVTNRQVSNYGNKGVGILGRWTPENPSTTRERLIWNGGAVFRNHFQVYDGSYLKLKSLTVSYDLPKAMLDKAKLRMASFYLTATNLFTITNYPGLDPETTDNPASIIGGGRDVSSYPTTKELTIGLRLGF